MKRLYHMRTVDASMWIGIYPNGMLMAAGNSQPYGSRYAVTA
jgi:hypothetical protein